MTAAAFHAIARATHPDAVGNASRVAEFMAAVAEKKKHDAQNRNCLCGCGKRLNPSQIRRRCTYATPTCWQRVKHPKRAGLN